ncbi:MAG: DUF2516 family protein [Actinomycetia bacterium]|nr:DUF2516 family protein [Actinomycetes bacterium]
MQFLGQAQMTVALAIGVALLAMQAFAFIDCLRHRPDAFVAADKRTKGLWLAITGAALLFGFITFRNPLNIFMLLSALGAGVYLADVRPALKQVSGRGPRRHDTW